MLVCSRIARVLNHSAYISSGSEANPNTLTGSTYCNPCEVDKYVHTLSFAIWVIQMKVLDAPCSLPASRTSNTECVHITGQGAAGSSTMPDTS